MNSWDGHRIRHTVFISGIKQNLGLDKGQSGKNWLLPIGQALTDCCKDLILILPKCLPLLPNDWSLAHIETGIALKYPMKNIVCVGF